MAFRGKGFFKKTEMKNRAVATITVLFLLVGFGYVNAQSSMEGSLNSLHLKITYQDVNPGNNNFSDGKELITVESGLDKVKKNDVALTFTFDGTGNLSTIDFSWINLDLSRTRIYTIDCMEVGTIHREPRLSAKNTPKTEIQSWEGVAICKICPEGFPTINFMPDYSGLCNSGDSPGQGSLIYKATVKVSTTADTPTPDSILLRGEINGGGFYYVNGDWEAPKGCEDSNGCQALLEGTFESNLTPYTSE
jgi:hypothetical protein